MFDFGFQVLDDRIKFIDFFVFTRNKIFIFVLHVLNHFEPFSVLETKLFVLLFEIVDAFNKVFDDLIFLCMYLVNNDLLGLALLSHKLIFLFLESV